MNKYNYFIFMALVFGAFGWLIHSWLIIDAATHTGAVFEKWTVWIDYNALGEGPVELVFIPGVFLTLTYSSYWYLRNRVLPF